MALKTINNFAAAAALALTDLVPLWQSSTVRTTLQALITFISRYLETTVNAQTGTTYAYVAGDRGKLVTHTNASAIAATIAQAGTTGFASGYYVWIQNRGAGVLTITPTTSTIDGAATLILHKNQGVMLHSDGTNYFTTRGMGGSGGVAALTDGANIAVDASRASSFRVTLGGNRTLDNPTNLTDGQVLNFRIKQDATGSRTLTYGSKYKWAGGTAGVLSTTANANDFLSCQYDATDDTLYCVLNKAFA